MRFCRIAEVDGSYYGVTVNSGSLVKDCKIHNINYFGLRLEGASQAIGNEIYDVGGGNNPIVDISGGSVFRYNWMHDSSGSTAIRSGGGVNVIEYNTIGDATGAGDIGIIVTYSTPTIRYNNIGGFNKNIVVANTFPIINYNTFMGSLNPAGGQRNVWIATEYSPYGSGWDGYSGEAGTQTVDLKYNYWSNVSAGQISASIHDFDDDYTSKAKGVYTDPLASAHADAPLHQVEGLSAQTGPTTMQLSWTANSESDIAGYKVYYDTDGSGWPYANSASTGSTAASYTLIGLSTGTTHYVAVVAVDSDDNESWVSNEVSATTASKPTNLALLTQPSGGSAGTALSAQPIVKVTDLEANLVASSSPSITVSITSGTGTSGATLLGTTTVNAVDGVATFSDLQINTAGSDYTLTVSSSGLTSIVSSAFDIAAGPASTLVVATNPSESAANDVFSTQPGVYITDGNGNIITTATGTVTAAIASGLGTLTGTASVAASAGVATFTGLGIDTKGDDYQLGFSSPGLVSATSAAFNIISATPVSLSFTSSPTGGSAGEASALVGTVLVLDKNGNQVVDSSAEITLEITDDTGNDEGELSGTVTINATNGQAVFSGVSINLVGDNYSVTATSSGLTEATSSTFNITAGSPVALGFVTEPGGAQTARLLETQPVVGFVDSQGNPVAIE